MGLPPGIVTGLRGSRTIDLANKQTKSREGVNLPGFFLFRDQA